MTAVYTFIAEEQADPACDWSICEMCRVLEVSRSGFYDWQTRGPSARELEDRVLAREIELIWIASDETYGVPRMTAWLVRQGFEVNHKRVGRIMRELGLEGESGRRRVRTTIVDKGATARNPYQLTWTLQSGLIALKVDVRQTGGTSIDPSRFFRCVDRKYMPTPSRNHPPKATIATKVVCPRFRTRRTTRNPLTSMFARPTPLMCPSTAEPGPYFAAKWMRGSMRW